MSKKSNFLKALAIFTNTVIGVGIFGLPYVAMKTGFFVVIFYFFVVAILSIFIHCLLAEVSRDTDKFARIPGYAEEYLGSKAKIFSFFISSLGLIGALLAYLIVGSEFFYFLFSPYLSGSYNFYLLIYFLFGTFLIYKGIKSVARFELIMFIFFIFVLFLFLIRGLPHLHFENFLTFNPRLITFPYGIVIFSLWGVALVPEVKEILERDLKKIKLVISLGIIIATFCYLFFVFIILGTCGLNTSKDAISGFAKSISDKIVAIGYLFGLITTFTSFLTLGLTLKKIFWLDFKIPRNLSCFIACFIPLILYFLGFKNFIEIISFTGALMLGVEGIIVILIYKNFIQKRFQRKPSFWLNFLIALLLLGIIFEFIYFMQRL
jgi:tyrosine-specific transport protein